MARQIHRLVEVPFSKTECGVDFYINTEHGSDRPGVLTEYSVFKTDFFEARSTAYAKSSALVDDL